MSRYDFNLTPQSFEPSGTINVSRFFSHSLAGPMAKHMEIKVIAEEDREYLLSEWRDEFWDYDDDFEPLFD